MARRVIVWACLCLWSSWATASVCVEAARLAAHKYSVPEDVLIAITLTETGRGHGENLRPWPWAVNAFGAGEWHADKRSALEGVKRALARGNTNVDVGCFQLNYRWHGAGFDTLADMIAPQRNADYAAQFLKRLYWETGSWREAAGHYHSRTPRHRDRYLARFDAMRIAGAALHNTLPPPLPGQAGSIRWISLGDPDQNLLRRAVPLFGAAE